MTTTFTATIGINAGYSHANSSGGPVDIVAAKWQEHAAAVLTYRGLYASGTVVPGRSVYHTDWGCPPGGEVVAVVSGTRSPEFCRDDLAWRAVVREVARRVGRDLGQTRVYLSFHSCELEVIEG